MYLKFSISYFKVDIKAIQKRKFKVVIDCVNGAGGLIIPQLLEKLGCEKLSLSHR